MNFERGKKAKESMNIGAIADPIHIHSMYTSDPDFPTSLLAPGKSFIFQREESSNLTHDAVWRTLAWIEKSALGAEWEELFFVGVWDENEEEWNPKPETIRTFQIHPIKNYKGMYLMYSGVKYKIPLESREHPPEPTKNPHN